MQALLHVQQQEGSNNSRMCCSWSCEPYDTLSENQIPSKARCAIIVDEAQLYVLHKGRTHLKLPQGMPLDLDLSNTRESTLAYLTRENLPHYIYAIMTRGTIRKTRIDVFWGLVSARRENKGPEYRGLPQEDCMLRLAERRGDSSCDDDSLNRKCTAHTALCITLPKPECAPDHC